MGKTNLLGKLFEGEDMDFDTNNNTEETKTDLQVKCRTLLTFSGVHDVVNLLKANYPVVVNLQRTKMEDILRITDFLSGALLAIDGELTAIGTNIWICTPAEVAVEGSFTPEVEMVKPQPAQHSNQHTQSIKKLNDTQQLNSQPFSPYGDR